MRVIIIGGTGHVGTYLVPRLVEAGYEVICINRQQKVPYQPHPAWERVQLVKADRTELERTGDFGSFIAELAPQVVIDMVCFNPDSARQLVESLRSRIEQYLFCGTMWVYGHSIEVPVDETHPRQPIGEYGIQKAATEKYLLTDVDQRSFPATILHPGHIVGPGWQPINPAGNLNPDVFSRLAKGEEVILPNIGMETLHHVHADDVAQGFMQAILHRSEAIGESFNMVSPKALTLRGYAESMAAWFGQTALLRYVPWDEFRQLVSPKDARLTWDHIVHSPSGSIEKARRLLNYSPRYSSLEAVQEALRWQMSRS
ncbi:hypothetical protein GCM10028807_10250 [Spirosoma daeguense]